MENKTIVSLEQLTPDVANNKSDFIKINEDISAVIRPNQILYIETKKKNDFKNYSIESKEIESKNDFLSITFVPTLDCNLNCIYCYSRGGETKNYMDSEIAIGFLKTMYNLKKPSSIHLRFAGGGEPFLNFDCIKKIVKIARDLSNKVSIHCITNGTFNKEQLGWILKEKPHVRISYDGNSQEIQRPYKSGENPSNLIRENIKKLIKNKIEVVIQTTITSLNIFKMKDIISEAIELGVKTIKMEPVYITENSRGNNKLNVSPKEFASNFLEVMKYIKENNFNIQIDTAFFSRPTLGHYCSMPTGNFILTPRGNITGCVEITNNCDHHSEDVFYGKFDKSSGEIKFDESKKKEFKNFHFSNFEKCSFCSLKLICRGGCPLRRIWGQENHSCEITKILVPQILKLFYEDPSYMDILIKK